MVELKQEEEKKIKCFLVGAPNKDDAIPAELKGLVKTLGMEVAGMMVLARIEPTPVYGIGTGKAQEIVDSAKECFAECIIFDWTIDPSKQRNWEKLATMPVFDRNEVIIRIFDQRARTREASLQVELARLVYSLPRLSHMYGDMARQRGGAFGNKGSGETQKELDRRQIEEKIIQLKKELEQVVLSRETQRKQRERMKVPSCALVGYTNAGKSSLLNALTGADVFVENELFATLDPTTRKMNLSDASQILMTDTVGFISNLPHSLIDAFKSTLEETNSADYLLVVVDASDENAEFQYNQVIKVLGEIGASEIPRKILLNKYELIEKDDAVVANLKSLFPDAIHVSAKTEMGFDKIHECLVENLLGHLHDFKFSLSECNLVELVRKNGTIEKEEWLDDSVEISARIPSNSRTFALVKDYVC